MNIDMFIDLFHIIMQVVSVHGNTPETKMINKYI